MVCVETTSHQQLNVANIAGVLLAHACPGGALALWRNAVAGCSAARHVLSGLNGPRILLVADLPCSIRNLHHGSSQKPGEI